MKEKLKKSTGITLVALVVTIVVLLILAGITITYVMGDNSIFKKAQEAKNKTDEAMQNEQEYLNNLGNIIGEYINGDPSKPPIYDKDKKVNVPQILTGMIPIKFEMPTDSKKGNSIDTTKADKEWYEYGETYETRKWANARTQDGSMWVWIPRFAYKITVQTIDVVFLIGTTDQYYKADGTIGTAQRMKDTNTVPDTTADYTVHPAFTNETAIGYSNGGWDKELTGIWVAKFEAGYPTGNNNATKKASNVSYTTPDNKVWAKSTEVGSTKNDWLTGARNWLDGVYGENETKISYPVFQGTTYAMNYITGNDAYNISRALTDSGNIYGLSSSNTDSHMMKNSEWGAVAYLSQSKYGQNGTKIIANNASLDSGGTSQTKAEGNQFASLYAVTGCAYNTTNIGEVKTTIEAINGTTGNTATAEGIYTWNQKNGQNASTTGTIYGIYDMNGGSWETVSAYIANNHEYLKKYGASIAYQEESLKTASTKYTTVYPNNEAGETNINTASRKNFAANTKIYGDAVRETTSSTAGTTNTGWNASSWNSEFSYFPAFNVPFFARGGCFTDKQNTGIFAFYVHHCQPHFPTRFSFCFDWDICNLEILIKRI